MLYHFSGNVDYIYKDFKKDAANSLARGFLKLNLLIPLIYF